MKIRYGVTTIKYYKSYIPGIFLRKTITDILVKAESRPLPLLISQVVPLSVNISFVALEV